MELIPSTETMSENEIRQLAEKLLAFADMAIHAKGVVRVAQEEADMRVDQLIALYENIPPEVWDQLTFEEQQAVLSNLPK
jgi:UV DNA damage repair endonuclease